MLSPCLRSLIRDAALRNLKRPANDLRRGDYGKYEESVLANYDQMPSVVGGIDILLIAALGD